MSARLFATASIALALGACSCAPSVAIDAGSDSAIDAIVTEDTGLDAFVAPPACPDAVVLIDPANLDPDGVYRAHVETIGHLDERSCARDGPSTERSGAIVHVRASVAGSWRFRAVADHITTQQLRTDCSDPDSEISCEASSSFSDDHYPIEWTAEAGETIDWLLRSRDESATFDVEAWPPRLEGDSCLVATDDASHVSVPCVAPFTCQNWAAMPTCATNTLPTLERAELYLDPSLPSGHLVLWGTDETPTLTEVLGTGPDRVFSFYIVAPRFAGASYVVDIRNSIYESAYYDVAVRDTGGLSNTLRVVPQPAGENEPCEGSPSFCPSSLRCQDDGGGTMRCLP